jgi:hypothetical protein
MSDPVTITRSTSVVPDADAGEGFWPDAIERDEMAIPTLAANATPTDPCLTWSFISDLEGPVQLTAITLVGAKLRKLNSQK